MLVEYDQNISNRYRFPCLVFFTEPNPDFGKSFTEEDIETPSVTIYNYYVDDCLTLNKKNLDFEQWVSMYKERELIYKQMSAKCERNVSKIGVNSFEDIEQFYKSRSDIMFVDEEIRKEFGMNNE